MKLFRLFNFILCILLFTGCIKYPVPDDNYLHIEESEQIHEIPTAVESPTGVKNTPTIKTETASYTDFGQSARSYLEVLSEEIGERLAGSGNADSAAQYIERVFNSIGYSTEKQWFTAYDDYEGASFGSLNIIAIKEGLSDQQIIVGAHYDSVDVDGSQGADDNASGVAVMLEVAQRVIDKQTPYTIVFVAFGAEEEGLWGSADFVDQLTRQQRKNIVGMVNLDCLIAGDKVYIYGNDGPGTMRDWTLNDAGLKQIEIEGKTDEELFNEDGTPCECSDFDAFEKSDIPYVYFEATNWDFSSDGMVQVDPRFGNEGEIRHSEYDTIEYIEKTFPGRIDHHLNIFVTLLFDLVTGYQEG